MLFNSIEFLLFLPVVFALYWLLRGHLRLQNLFVVAASYVFYGWWDWRFLALITFTSAWSYAVGVLELRHPDRPHGSRLLLTASLVVNLGILGVFKYFNFFVDSFAALLRTCGVPADTAGLGLEIVLPVGVSFYTFQALSYTIDVYRRTLAPTRDPLAFFAFISFFPQLVAGPIERATNLLPQFTAPRTFSFDDACGGCRLMLWGLFKKCVVADNCAVVANALLNDPAQGNGFAVAIGVLAFAFQIYGDFSGYSDIAIGCARLFGVKLMRNFACPYFARDIAEFWRRWHISLTTWFRDYLYIPLGGSRCGTAKRVRNTFAIFLVSGLWHGANWTFVLWGAFHALLFLPLLLGGRNRKYLGPVAEGRALPTAREAVRIVGTFALVTLGWAFFRAQDASELVRWLAAVFNPLSWGALPHPPRAVPVAAASVVMMALAEWLNRDRADGPTRLPRNRALRWAVYYALVWLVVFYTPGSQTFIYFQF